MGIKTADHPDKTEKVNTGKISDGYHTFDELYEFRKQYNCAFFNLLATLERNYDVHKSLRHSDGNECFGGGWFIVVAQLRNGQISNHYKIEDWDMFNIPIKEKANDFDGHTPQDVLNRLNRFNYQEFTTPDEPKLMQREYTREELNEFAITDSKRFRVDLDKVLQQIKNSKRNSRERSIAITKIQEAIMWLGMDLKDLGNENPYPNSYNPSNTIVDKTADNLIL